MAHSTDPGSFEYGDEYPGSGSMMTDDPSTPRALVVLNLSQLERQVAELFPPSPFIYTTDGILQTVFITIGFFGTMVAIPIYTRPRVWSCINYYLISLAVADAILMASYFFSSSLWVLYFGGTTVKTYGWHIRIVYVTFVTHHVSSTLVVWLTALLTVERYYAICHPFKHIGVNRDRRIQVSIAVAVTLAVAYNIVRIYELEIQTVSLQDMFADFVLEFPNQHNTSYVIADNQTVQALVPTDMYKNGLYFMAYKVVGRILFDTVVPLLVVALLTARMCFALLKATKERECFLQRDHSLSKKPASVRYHSGTPILNRKLLDLANESLKSTRHFRQGSGASLLSATSSNAASRMNHPNGGGASLNAPQQSSRVNLPLLVLLGKFLLSHSFPAAVTLMELMIQEDFNRDFEMAVLMAVTNVLVIANSATNCCVFLLLGQKFRIELRTAFLQLLSKVGLYRWDVRLNCSDDPTTITESIELCKRGLTRIPSTRILSEIRSGSPALAHVSQHRASASPTGGPRRNQSGTEIRGS